jgi:hypothetical protein
MMYYRVAIQASDEASWRWKSTPLSSLEALFQLLRLYRAIPQDQLRVFMAFTRQEMDAMLEQENKSVATTSVTAEQFLSQRRICSLSSKQEGSRSRTQEQQSRRVSTITPPPLVAHGTPAEAMLQEQALSALERRRLELEMGEGGDHNQPYTFALPVLVPQLLAWTRLLIRVQHGELLP